MFHSKQQIIHEKVENVDMAQGVYIAQDSAYKTDLDHHFNEDGMTDVFEMLQHIGFPELYEIFLYEKIDNEVLPSLDQNAIMMILHEYPVGIRLKFFYKLRSFLDNIPGSQNIDSYASCKSLASNSSSLNEQNVDENTVYKIMYQTDEGKKFMKNFPTDKALNSKAKVEISGIICGHLLNDGVKIGRKGARLLAESIASIFKKEDASIYFDGKAGILYSKANYLANKLKDKIIIEEPATKKIKVDFTSDLAYTTEEINSDDFIRCNPLASLNELMYHWNMAYRKRSHDIKNLKDCRIKDIIDIYKSYGRSDGYFLIDADFKSLNPNVIFEDKWSQLKKQLTIVLVNNVANGHIKSKLDIIEKLTETSKSVALMYGLHGFLYSRSNVKNRETIEDGFEQMITIVPNEGTVAIKLNSLREKLLHKKQPLQPVIFCIGEDIENIKENVFILAFDEFKYSFVEFSSVFKTYLQMFTVFNLCYPSCNRNVYEFLASVLLDQESILNPKCKSLRNLISNVDIENVL